MAISVLRKVILLTTFVFRVLDLIKSNLQVQPFGAVKEGTDVSLECQVDGTHPLPYTWLKNGQLLTNTEARNEYLFVNRSMTGIYSCQAQNNFRIKLSDKILLDVQCKSNSICWNQKRFYVF